MNVHLHPSSWLHQQHAEREHLRQIFHSEVFLIVIVTLAVLVVTAAMILMVGKASPVNPPYLPSFPF